MPSRVDDEISNINHILGTGGEAKIIPVLIPAETYRILLEIGQSKGISPADVLANAIVMYAQPPAPVAEAKPAPRREVDVFIRKSR